jgi:hypothetical protein
MRRSEDFLPHFVTSPNRLSPYRNAANGSDFAPKTLHWRPFATPRYTSAGFRFRYRKVWGFKSLLVHRKKRAGAEFAASRCVAWRRPRDLEDDRSPRSAKLPAERLPAFPNEP